MFQLTTTQKTSKTPAQKGFQARGKAALTRAICGVAMAAAAFGASANELINETASIDLSAEQAQSSEKALQASRLLPQALEALQSLTIEEQLVAVNTHWNGLRQIEDIDNYGVSDVWTTPLETLERGAGDCEDLAIGKFYALLNLGVAESDLKIAHVKAENYGAHMVLLYTDSEGKRWVLDNLNRSIETFEDRSDLTLVYSLNRQELRMAKVAHIKANPMKMTKWADLVKRASSELSI